MGVSAGDQRESAQQVTAPAPRSHAESLRVAHARLLRRQRTALRSVLEDIGAYRENIGRRLAGYRGINPDLVRLTGDLQEAELTLFRALNRSVRWHRRLTISDMLAIWTGESRPEVVRLASRMTEAGLYASLRNGVSFRAALGSATANAHGEIVEIVAEALRNGLSASALAQSIMPYLNGAESIPLPAGGKMDLRRIPTPLRGQARQLQFNAERIAVTELSIARAETEMLAFLSNPAVAAVRWVLSANRGKTRLPDICDALAGMDAYGLGPGVYPVDRVPPLPHPFCRCSRLPLAGLRSPGMRAGPVNLMTLAGYAEHPPGYQQKIATQFGTALADGERAQAVVEGFLSTAS